MSERARLPVAVMLLFIAAVQILALAITPAISSSGDRVFQDPSSTLNPFIYVILILGFTAFLLLAMRLKKGWIVGGFIQLSIAASIYYVLAAFLTPLLALLPTLAVMLLLRYYPEWYVIDAFGIVVCAAISALFGVSMDPLPTVVLLVILAVYDAISVYKTRHMVSLAEGVIRMKAPLLFVVPRSPGYSFRKDEFSGSSSAAASTENSTTNEKGRMGAYFLGLGDAIIPTILVISAYVTLPGAGILGIGYPAAGAMLGTYIGFLLLMTTSRERPQAGLPFLNSGVILGFLAGCMAAGVFVCV